MTECLDEQRTYRKHTVLPVEAVERVDAMRDHGRFREVDHVEIKLITQTILIYFADAHDPDDCLGITYPRVISLWRVRPQETS
jgi:hypothetical protein